MVILFLSYKWFFEFDINKQYFRAKNEYIIYVHFSCYTRTTAGLVTSVGLSGLSFGGISSLFQNRRQSRSKRLRSRRTGLPALKESQFRPRSWRNHLTESFGRHLHANFSARKTVDMIMQSRTTRRWRCHKLLSQLCLFPPSQKFCLASQ